MFKMKSERPLLINGIPQTEFETTEHHGKELISKGLATRVDAEETEPKMEAAPKNKMADAPVNKAAKKAD
jgi:hypothetical protein